MKVLASQIGPVDEDNCLDRIRHKLGQLNARVQRVASYVLENPWETRGISIVELAKRTGVSQNTVSRFCQALGYSGYREFSAQLILTLGQMMGAAYSTPPEAAESAAAGDGILQVVSNVFAMEVQGLQETIRRIDPAAVERAVEALSGARRVVVVGMGAPVAAASTIAYRLTLLGIDAVCLSDPYVMIGQANALGKGDVLFGITYLGQARAAIDAMQIARRHGATTIAMTASPGSLVARHADIALIVTSSMPMFATRQFAARAAGVVLADALATAVAWARDRGTSPRVLETFTFQRRYLEYDPILGDRPS